MQDAREHTEPVIDKALREHRTDNMITGMVAALFVISFIVMSAILF